MDTHPRMLGLLLTLAVVLLCPAWSGVALAADESGLGADEAVKQVLPRIVPPRQGFSTAAAETVWFGYMPTSLDRLKVHVGGRWDFDTNVAQTDSTQYWKFMQAPFAWDENIYPTPRDRPFWYFDWGNNINLGDHKLWRARRCRGRAFRPTGLAGVWHVDDMSTVFGSPGNIQGARSAWCGLRYTGDPNAPVDELTGNPFTNTEQYNDFRGGPTVRSAFPGFSNQWNQLLYRDFDYAGVAVNLNFKYRAQVSTTVPRDQGGTAWFSPDPTSMSNMVTGPADSFIVWAGRPKDTGVYDTNRRYLSEVIDFSAAGTGQPQKLFGVSGFVPADSVGFRQANLTIPAGQLWGSKVRVVFQVHTNRGTSDLAVSWPAGFNSRDGAVVLDDIVVGGVTTHFDVTTDIRPRVLLASNGGETPIDPTTTWISTGRPPAVYGHIHNVSELPYDDPCGGLDGSGGRQCNLANNILVQSDHDYDHMFHDPSRNWAMSPTICLNGPQAALQGTPAGLGAATDHIDVQFDYYSGSDGYGLSAVFFWYGVRYMGAGLAWLLQPAAPMVSNWSPVNALGYVNAIGAPACVTIDTDTDLAGLAPLAYVDSLQIGLETTVRCARFAATDCGNARGCYWDNIRCGFVKKGPVGWAVTPGGQNLLGDTFPFNENVAPGTAEFDTTTALVKTALNNGRPEGGEGVIPGDTLVYTSVYMSSWSGAARMDLVFRVWPGPGNYSGRYRGATPPDAEALRHTPLWKVPSDTTEGTATAGDASWWGQYMGNNGEMGSTPSGHTAAYWDPQTWNSARMDSAELDYYPLVSRGIGAPVVSTWMGTYHESDPKWATLGILQNLCYLIDKNGPADNTNICCSATECAAFGQPWPPTGYSGPTQTVEGTKILPDGLFTPGTLVQYFVRLSAANNPSVMENMSPDTNTVSYQVGMSGSADQVRYDHINVLPDMWKDERFGGTGLACILYVDAADRRGFEPSVRGALDSLGYGLDNGAERGWKRSPLNAVSVDDPAGFVPANVGQVGLAYDKFDIREAESSEGDHLGCRIVGGGFPAGLAGLQCKQGPTVDMLDHYYNTILWESGDLSSNAMHDGSGQAQQQADDAGLVLAWLDRAAPGNEKAFWGSGDRLAWDMANSNGTSMAALLKRMGAVFVGADYRALSGNREAGAVFRPLDADPGVADPFHSDRRYGILSSCASPAGSMMNVIERDGAVPGAERAARYEDPTDRGYGGANPYPYYASVYRNIDRDAGRYFATLLDGFSLDRLRGWNGVNDPTTEKYGLTYNNHAQQAWMDDVFGAFSLCARRAPVVGVGETPGLSAVNFVRGAFPNPSVAGAATVQFTLAQPAKVSIRFYNVAGRQVHEAAVDGVVGANSYRWNGVASTGARLAAGVYFYRLSAPGISFENNKQRMVLLGSAGK